jgi:AAA domain
MNGAWSYEDAEEEIRAAGSRPNGHAPEMPVIRATPFVWTDPASLPKREWLYGRHLIRPFLSATIAPGGFGKSSLIVTEALAMVTGRALLGDQPAGRLRVWQVNLEDPEDELRRRVAAAALHHRISPEEIGDRLFLDSGRNTEIIIATENRHGIEIAVPVIEAIKAEITAKAIDVLQVDPFVACHAVSENDNTKIAAVARQWAGIAETTGCAIDLVHHARKNGGGQAFTVEDARGASALIAAVRSARVLNGMSKEEAERASIENPTSYFSVSSGKANLAPRGDKATWRHMVGVPLGNGTSALDPVGDFVGVVEAWAWPDPFAEVSPADAKEVQRRIAQGELRADQRSTSWAGFAVAEVLGLDPSQPSVRAAVRSMLKTWVGTGALREVERLDDQRKPKKFVEVGEPLP